MVAHVQTGGIDPGSRAIMRGHGDVRDERIYQENPDLPLVLRTTFRALVVGFAEARQHLPVPAAAPAAPALLGRSPARPQRVRSFTSFGLDYLQALLAAPRCPVDELLAANLRLTAAPARRSAYLPAKAPVASWRSCCAPTTRA